MEPIIPTFFCIGILVWLGLRGIRKWIELFMNAGSDGDEPMSDNDKHMYN